MSSKIYLRSMAAFWLVFGLITTFYPTLMNLFLSEKGINQSTAFSNHVWFHGGLDILALVVVLFTLSTENISRKVLKGISIAALGPTIAIVYSLLFTTYWSNLFILSGLGTFSFFVWGMLLSNKKENRA